MILSLLLFTTLLSHSAEVANDATPTAATPSQNAGLPLCVNRPADIKKITSTMKANSETKFKYNGYRKIFAGESNEDLTTRLIYAEMVAANCPAQTDVVLPMIAGVITNRIDIRKGNVRSVVFERNQFASSLNVYDSSKYRDFLCPQDNELWNKAAALVEKKHDSLPKQAVNYFLYQHHPGWDKEPWELPETDFSKTSTVRNCIRVFENKNWK